MATKPTIARIWRGRTRRDIADIYEPYMRAEGIPPLQKVALDRDTELLIELPERIEIHRILIDDQNLR
ncbi:hypothetical protein [Mesorhizobium sp. B4-1-1]|uniref:hypothetical protein n=1 Tax=Mesorhizobium sp. B4-1-1 TaxID=2589890 RepID=UPI001129BD43|nr:hypothetical protein [Mesorhizobium sp. B4-1-1]TPI18360.1 hypothetical protein FJW10_19265 [Mesorhizobium sp. B4-1-1]